ncbi:MAG: hypothetical protein ABFD12_03250 [Syntrophorhabdus sp.]
MPTKKSNSKITSGYYCYLTPVISWLIALVTGLNSNFHPFINGPS